MDGGVQVILRQRLHCECRFDETQTGHCEHEYFGGSVMRVCVEHGSVS
jgi:hypothetical protein